MRKIIQIIFLLAEVCIDIPIVFQEEIYKGLLVARLIYGILASITFGLSLFLVIRNNQVLGKFEKLVQIIEVILTFGSIIAEIIYILILQRSLEFNLLILIAHSILLAHSVSKDFILLQILDQIKLRIISFILFLSSLCLDLTIFFNKDINITLLVARFIVSIFASVFFVKSLLLADIDNRPLNKKQQFSRFVELTLLSGSLIIQIIYSFLQTKSLAFNLIIMIITSLLLAHVATRFLILNLLFNTNKLRKISFILFAADVCIELVIIFIGDIYQRLLIARLILGVFSSSIYFKNLLLVDRANQNKTVLDKFVRLIELMLIFGSSIIEIIYILIQENSFEFNLAILIIQNTFLAHIVVSVFVQENLLDQIELRVISFILFVSSLCLDLVITFNHDFNKGLVEARFIIGIFGTIGFLKSLHIADKNNKPLEKFEKFARFNEMYLLIGSFVIQMVYAYFQIEKFEIHVTLVVIHTFLLSHISTRYFILDLYYSANKLRKISILLFIPDLCIEIAIMLSNGIYFGLLLIRFILGILASSLFFKSLLLADKTKQTTTKFDIFVRLVEQILILGPFFILIVYIIMLNYSLELNLSSFIIHSILTAHIVSILENLFDQLKLRIASFTMFLAVLLLDIVILSNRDINQGLLIARFFFETFALVAFIKSLLFEKFNRIFFKIETFGIVIIEILLLSGSFISEIIFCLILQDTLQFNIAILICHFIILALLFTKITQQKQKIHVSIQPPTNDNLLNIP